MLADFCGRFDIQFSANIVTFMNVHRFYQNCSTRNNRLRIGAMQTLSSSTSSSFASFIHNIKRHTIKLHVPLNIPIDNEMCKKRYYNHFKHQHPLFNSVPKLSMRENDSVAHHKRNSSHSCVLSLYRAHTV